MHYRFSSILRCINSLAIYYMRGNVHQRRLIWLWLPNEYLIASRNAMSNTRSMGWWQKDVTQCYVCWCWPFGCWNRNISGYLLLLIPWLLASLYYQQHWCWPDKRNRSLSSTMNTFDYLSAVLRLRDYWRYKYIEMFAKINWSRQRLTSITRLSGHIFLEHSHLDTIYWTVLSYITDVDVCWVNIQRTVKLGLWYGE